MRNFCGLIKNFKGVDAVLVMSEPNTFYLTGYQNDSAYILLTKAGAFYYTDTRYTEEAGTYVNGDAEVIAITYSNVYDVIFKKLAELNVKKLGFEGDTTKYSVFCDIKNAFSGIDLVAVDDVFYKLRSVKSRSEISLIKKAAAINDKAFLRMLKKVKEGITEKQLGAELEYQMKKLGADGLAFTTIVAFGQNTSRPHAHTGDTKLERGMPVTIDFGCTYKGYCSDITRTFAFGDPGEEFKKIYNEVLQSNLEGIKAVRAGVSGSYVDSVSRGYLKSKDLDKYFIHGTGHGVGVEIHEEPSVNARGTSPLEKNMIITVEPGVYMEGKFGVRIEDLILVNSDGCTVISQLDKKLLIL